jgi:CDP-glycerol glycerophosphotransferase (TagB/SpsB family)
MTFYPLYIDPGTGSALFSIAIGIGAGVYFLVKGVFLKLKIVLLRQKKVHQSKYKYVIYAEDKRYWTLFKPVVEEFEKLNTELLYLTSSTDDPVFNAGFQHIKAEYLGEGNRAFARLNFLSADFVLSTTPGLDVYQWKRSKDVKYYSHIFHTPSDSSGYELFGMDYYDSILVTGHDYQKDHIRKLEKARNLPEKQVVTVGCPYLDEYAEKIDRIPQEENHVFTVLVSPSWGKSALLSRFGEKLIDPLAKTGWRIIVRPHPQSFKVEKEIIDRLSAKYAENANVEWDFERDNVYSLKKADVMISDYSGIMLDYMFLRNKPVFYVADKLDLRTRDAFEIYVDQEEIWDFSNMIKGTNIEIKPEMLSELPDLISNVSSDISVESAIAELKAKAWRHQGTAGKQTADFMIKTASALTL